MTRKTLGFIFIVILFIVAGTVSWNLYFKVYRQADTVNIHTFPTQINDWSSTELPITDDEKAILETDNVFTRRYTTPSGKEAFLFIVYSENNRKVSHPPEICYTGSGVSVIEKTPDEIPTTLSKKDLKDGVFRANKLHLSRGNTEQIAFYWFKVGDSFTSSYWKQQSLIALKSFLGQSASSALIRISVTIRKGDKLKATAQIKEFGELIAPYLTQHLP